MEKEVRIMGEKNIDDIFDLAAYAFNAEKTEERKRRFKKIVAHSLNYGYFLEDALTSQVISTPFKVAFHGISYQMAGIGCVSSYPEYRGRGGISTIMKQLLAELAENKVELAYLAPFSYPFYRKYGFEQVFEQISYTVKAADWPNVKATPGKMKRVTYEEAKSVCQQIYSELPNNQRGAVIRESWWFEYAFGLDDKNLFALYEDELGNPQGYLIYQSSAERFVIKEWGYLTNQAFQSIIRFIGSHNGSSREFHLETGFDGENLSYLMSSPLVEMKVTPFMMARIVDLESFLRKYPFTVGSAEAYYLKIEDDYGSWNNGIWELLIDENGQSSVRELDQIPESLSEEDVIASTIQTLTQLFMGYRRGTQLHFYGKISGKEKMIQSLDQRLVTGMPILADYF
ncbi:GNAT family N-acetyltransferase [Enterococcus ureasiticus]|uniref:GNAT family N-acetyltransferase n=1 Tax=Enterococcus ureasiticus TaxID=903984 RepID=A0A1E5GFC2_9ENTE|nr:GNAT family N-acetyltransferase [Enterococcus ureasiticus]OEG11428.1 GNAT family N-acetyltransferase [Enterococcus ureasiticus]